MEETWQSEIIPSTQDSGNLLWDINKPAIQFSHQIHTKMTPKKFRDFEHRERLSTLCFLNLGAVGSNPSGVPKTPSLVPCENWGSFAYDKQAERVLS